MSELNLNQKNEKLLPAPEIEERLPAGEKVELIEAGEVAQSRQENQAENARQEIEKTIAPNETSALKDTLNDAQDSENTLPDSSSYIGDDLRSIVKNREVENIRRRLPSWQRPLSRLVHNPFISSTSEIAAKSISRPSGMLGGGILAFIGTAGYYFLTRRIGMKYNYSIFFILFVGGFIVGLMLEIFIYGLTIKKRRLE